MENKKQEVTLSKKEKFKVWMKEFFFSFIWLGLLMVILDIVSKQCVVAFRETIWNAGPNGVILIPGFLAVNYLVNTNIIFGLSFIKDPVVTRVLYIIFGSLLTAGVISYYCIKRKKLSKYVKAVLMLIISGAIGNLIDRIFYNAQFLQYPGPDGELVANGVVDWINFYGVWKFNFNWADACIVVGVIMLVIWLIITSIIDYAKEKKKEPKVVVKEKQLSQDEIKKLEKQKADSEKELNKRNDDQING